MQREAALAIDMRRHAAAFPPARATQGMVLGVPGAFLRTEIANFQAELTDAFGQFRHAAHPRRRLQADVRAFPAQPDASLPHLRLRVSLR